MEFGGDADVGMLQNVSMLRIERGSGTSAPPPEVAILLHTISVVLGPIADINSRRRGGECVPSSKPGF